MKCEHCLGSLFGHKQNLVGSFLDFKNRGGLSYPSEQVLSVCFATEKVFRMHRSKEKERIQKKRIILDVLEVQIQKVKFSCNEHTYLLIKAIANVYIDLRIRFECKKLTESREYIRNSFHKLIHFKGQ